MYNEGITNAHYLMMAIAYLLGSIPFGLLVAKYFKNIDIREYGSNNIGATNVARVCGKKLGLITLIADGLKGVAMVLVARCVFEAPELVVILCAIAAVLGHVFPIWLNFKGGKGVATTLITLIAVNWMLGLFMAFTWLFVFFVFKISSLAALTAVLATSFLSTYMDPELSLMMAFLCVLIMARHRANIGRLLKGREGAFKKEAKKETKPKVPKRAAKKETAKPVKKQVSTTKTTASKTKKPTTKKAAKKVEEK